MSSVDTVWLELAQKIKDYGNTRIRRGFECKEICPNTTTIPMSRSLMTLKDRKLNYRFMFGEAWWIASGRNDVQSISSRMKAISNFSDNGYFFNGAYGPMIVDQLSYIIDSFSKDINTRQAVLTIWRPNPRDSKDFPCTLTMHFMLDEGKLNTFVTMRSSDIFLGWVYDVFNFSMVTLYLMYILKELHHIPKETELGNLYLTANNQHAYARDLATIDNMLSNKNNESHIVPHKLFYLENDPTGNKFGDILLSSYGNTASKPSEALLDYLEDVSMTSDPLHYA